MRMTKWLSTLVAVAGFTLAVWPVCAQQDQSQSGSSQQQTGDSVADAARKAREQQKTAPKPKKVFTDDDIKPRAGDASAVSGSNQSQGAAQADSGQAGSGTDTGGAKDDPAMVWKKRFADQRAKIAAAEKELDLLQKESQKAEVQYYPDPQKALTEQFTRKDINDKLAKIDAKKQEIAKLKQQLDDMETELRKSGGDPGWAR